MLFRARSAPFCAHSRNLGTKVLLFFDICKHSALFLSFSLIFLPFPSFLSRLSLSPSFYVVYVHYPECHSGSLLRPLVGDLIAALSLAFDAGCSFWRHICRQIRLSCLLDSPLLSLYLLRPNLIRTSHPKHRPVFDASNADVAPSLSIYAGFFCCLPAVLFLLAVYGKPSS